MDRLTQARVGLDLGAPVLEQLVLARLLADPARSPRRRTAPGCASSATRLAAAVARAAARVAVPAARRRAGAVVRAARPRSATAVAAEAERRGVIVAPGPVFAAEGGLDRFVRIPWTRPADELERGRRPARRGLGGRARPGDGCATLARQGRAGRWWPEKHGADRRPERPRRMLRTRPPGS